jgi:cullin 1
MGRLLQLALVQWRDNFFRCVYTKLVDVILRLIERERNGETIDQVSVKKVVDSFVSLGLDEEDIDNVSLDVYKEHLETPFLNATEEFYEQESNKFQALAPSSSRNLLSLWRIPWHRQDYRRTHCLSDYLKKAEERLKEEEDRVDRYLNTETRNQLISKCEQVLIRPHSDLMWESFQSLLDFDKDEDLRRVYVLLSRMPEGLEPLRKTFEEHSKKAGLAAVAKLLSETSGGADLLDPKAYVSVLLEVHHKNSETITRSLRGDAGFIASLDKACREFVNCNAATGSSTAKSPALLLAKRVDMLLRRNNKMAQEDLERALNRVVCT